MLAYPARAASGAVQPPSPFAEEARAAVGGEWEELEEELFGPAEALHATFQALRDELLAGVPKVAKGLGELRLDTDLDVTHAVVRYLELVKLAALLQRPPGQSVAEALAPVNERLAASVSPLQREVLQTSTLDELLLDAERDDRARAAARAARARAVARSRSCRAAATGSRCRRRTSRPTARARCATSSRACCACRRSRRSTSASGSSCTRCSSATTRAAPRGHPRPARRRVAEARLRRLRRGAPAAREGDGVAAPLRAAASPRSPSSRSGSSARSRFGWAPHTLRGRVDRVDRLRRRRLRADRLQDRPPALASRRCKEDVQLSLYAVGAREAWQLDATQQAYLYVLDDEKVRVPSDEIDAAWIADTVDEVGAGILAQDFEPTPSHAACSMCDFRIACPASER